MPKDAENKIFILLITLYFMNADNDSWGVREQDFNMVVLFYNQVQDLFSSGI